MKRILFALFVFVAALVPAGAEERIARFVSDVDVQRNGDLLVTETIQIWAEGQQIKRGILRDFPTTYHRADGSRVEVGFDVQSVMRDGSHRGVRHREDGERRARAHRQRRPERQPRLA